MSPSTPAAPPRCLTDAEIAELQSADPGRAPQGLALHLASCERCQQRALAGGAPRPRGAGRAVPEPPSVKRTLLLALLALGAMAAFFWTLRHLAGQIR